MGSLSRAVPCRYDEPGIDSEGVEDGTFGVAGADLMALLTDTEVEFATRRQPYRPGPSTDRDAAGKVIRRLRRIWTTRSLVLLAVLDGAGATTACGILAGSSRAWGWM
jgi:hypothetical protein